MAVFEWMMQSLPMRAPGPIVTLGKTTVLSPIDAPSPTHTKAPIETSRPIRELPATAACGWIPGAGRQAGAKRPTARANARYGSAVRSIAHGARGASSLSSTADARVVFSADSYFGL